MDIDPLDRDPHPIWTESPWKEQGTKQEVPSYTPPQEHGERQPIQVIHKTPGYSMSVENII